MQTDIYKAVEIGNRLVKKDAKHSLWLSLGCFVLFGVIYFLKRKDADAEYVSGIGFAAIFLPLLFIVRWWFENKKHSFIKIGVVVKKYTSPSQNKRKNRIDYWITVNASHHYKLSASLEISDEKTENTVLNLELYETSEYNKIQEGEQVYLFFSATKTFLGAVTKSGITINNTAF